jgi:RNA polymerase sigma-70 factor (ECF subfamily)
MLKDSDAASDVVQDVFLKFFRLAGQGASIYDQRAYLYRMARNAALDYLKRNRHIRYEIPDTVSATPDDAGNRQDAIEQKEIADSQQKIIAEVLAALPPQARIIFEKSRVEGKKYREISIELNISEKTVEAHMSKALKIIRDFIRVNGIHYSLLFLLLHYAAA